MDRYYQFLQRHWLNILLWLYIFFIIFSTVVPFNFIWSTTFLPARIAKIQWIPFKDGLKGLDRSDIIANIIFFVPLGIILTLKVILREYRNLKLGEWLRIILTGALVSAGVEVLQIFTFDRTTSTTDVITNTIGTFLGGLLMLFFYLKFHREIKLFLVKVFAGKPEMIIAGLFLIFITLSTLAPFTFRIAWYSVKAQILSVEQNPFMVRNPVGELLTHMLLFGTFIYFLLSGLERYFYNRIRRLEIAAISFSLLILPVFLEIIQLIVPIRNHSLTDIFINQLAVLLILIYYFINLKIHPIKFTWEYFVQRHVRFFYFLTFVYLLYIVQRVAFSELSVSSWVMLKSMIPPISNNSKALRNFNRLNLLILLAKELFAFLPAGFILSLTWLKKYKKSMRRLLLIFFTFSIPLVYYYLGSTLERLQLNLLDFAAASSGIILGYVCWHIYEFMIEKNVR